MKKAKNVDLKTLVGLIRKAKSFCIATHKNPDGDGLGSILALAMGLKQLKKKVTLYTIDPVPKMYHFLPGNGKIKHKLSNKEKFDVSFIVDLGEIERVGDEFKNHANRGLTISLDHHAKGKHNCDLNFCLPKQASSGEVIYKILKTLKVKLNKAMATNIFTAMVTDTGSFKYSNTSEETFQIAADLARFKLDTWDVALHCFETFSLPRMELLKRVINRMQIHANKKVAWIDFRQSDFDDTGATTEDTEGFINYPRSIEGVEVAIALKEDAHDKYRVSLRSKKYVDVADVALKFGGGGHLRAAGCTVLGSFDHVQSTVLSEVLKRL